MSYGTFLAIFVAVPLCLELLVVRRLSRRVWLTLGAVSLVALLYTAPWDNLIILNGVWSYGRHQVAGIVLGYVPLEEYVFYVLQVFLTGVFTVLVLRRVGR